MHWLSANLSFLFADRPLPKRYEAAARAGFTGVECNDIFEMTIGEVRAALAENDLRLVLLNVPPGSGEGELGCAAIPGREAEAQANFQLALDYAVALGVPTIHYIAGRRPTGVSREQADASFLEALARDADLADQAGIILTLEPLNPIDRPDYHILSIAHALYLLAAIGRENVRLQLDLYHCAMRGESVSAAIETYVQHTAHVQIASSPSRSEPMPGGNPDPVTALHVLAQHGYQGWIGCEYLPAGDTVAGLKWTEGLAAELTRNVGGTK